MRLIKIEKNGSGGHACQTIDRLTKLPKGWAIIPNNMDTPNLPYGDITVKEICGVMTVTSWTPGEMPEIPNANPTPTAQDDMDTMIIDHEYRITLLELEV